MMYTGKAAAFFAAMRGKTVAVCGLGRNNGPVVRQFLAAGARVIGCDRRTREELGEVGQQLEEAGASLRVGESYLDGLDGVDLIVRTPGMKPYLPAFQAARAAGVTVTSEMELFFDLCPAPIFGVTGSDGKTTTTTIIAGLLAAAGQTVHLGGNIGRPLLPDIAAVRDTDVAVVELSSFQLTDMRQSPFVAVVTNVAPNHLDWHTDMDEYVQAKRNLVAWQAPGGRAVLNADNDYTAAYAEGLDTVFWFSRRHPVERGAFLREDGMLVMRDGGRDTEICARCDILLRGDHNVENYLAAICAVWGYVSPEVIAEYARTFGGVAHRCELVRTRGGVQWYNDSIGSSPSRTVAGLAAFDRPVILIAGGYDKNIPYAPLGEAAVEAVSVAILLGATADKIEQALHEAGARCPVMRVANMAEAVQAAAAIAKAGDIVFMSPASASFDMYPNFEVRGDHFRQLVLALPEPV